jgi:hypothetical protein
VLALSAAAVAVLLAGCSSDGVGAVADDDGFSSCVEKAGASLDGSEDWDEKEQLAFWGKTGTLDCALDELDGDQRTDALAGGFQDLGDGDEGDALSAQRTVLRDWAGRAGEERSPSDAARRAGLLLASLWVAGEDDPGAANGAKSLMAFSLYVGEDGQPTGFEDYLANHTGNVTDPNDQVLHFVDRMQEDSNKGEQQAQEWERLKDLVDVIDDAYDDARDE